MKHGLLTITLAAALVFTLSAGASAGYGQYTRDFGSEPDVATLVLMADSRGSFEKSDRFKKLSPEEQERLKERYERFRKLPPEEQERIKRRMERFKELPPEKQERIKKRMERWKNMPPEEKQKYRDSVERYRSLPEGERNKIEDRMRDIRKLPKDERRQERRKLREELKERGIRVPRHDRRGRGSDDVYDDNRQDNGRGESNGNWRR